tara:strand:+ start:2759 stop:3319 length:561 start_codon:yes stop_codon:yes gene_type:complete
MMLKQIPNVLTASRFVLTGPFLFFLLSHNYKAAFYIFFIAGISDALDGFLARYFNWQTPLGSFIDPLADKLLITASFVSLAMLGHLPMWLMILVLCRDFSIGLGLLVWRFFIRKKIVYSPTMLSKCNTIFQLSLLTFCLFELAYYQIAFFLVPLFIMLTAVTTCLSFVDYAWLWIKKALNNSHSVL